MRLTAPALAAALAVSAVLLPGPATAGTASADQVLARAYLPSPERVHGELRLVRRDDALCMQTLLYSNSLRRGVDRIRKKELYHWPAGRPGAEDSARYLGALEQAKRHALERSAATGNLADPRPRLLIEFVLGSSDARVAFYDVEVERTADGFVVRDPRQILAVEASREYVARAIRIQGDEGFDTPAPELTSLPH